MTQDGQIMGSIGMFAGTFPPREWAFCNGQLLAINDNQSLFSILGTNFGGDGRTTFALPDLRGRVPVHSGNSAGPGLSPYRLGQRGGVQENILVPSQLPTHNHSLAGVNVSMPSQAVAGSIDVQVSDNAADSRAADLKGFGLYAVDKSGDIILVYDNEPVYSGKKISGVKFDLATVGGTAQIASGVTGNTGSGVGVNNLQPYLAVHYCIAVYGIYPSRS